MKKCPATFEVTVRTLHGRLLLRPSKILNLIIIGIIGRALARYPLDLHLVTVASNHIHLLLTVDSVKRLSEFMCYFNSKLAREAGRLHDWKERIFGKRYTAIEITDEAEMIRKAVYLLSHGCKEGLVLRPGDWPGVNSVAAVTRGKALKGVWYDRSKQYEAGRCGEPVSRRDFATPYEISLSPLPCFAGLCTGEQRSRFRAIVCDIERATLQQVQREGRRILGAKKVLAQSPHRLVSKLKKRPAPLCHSSDPEERRRYRDDYRWFATLYRRASARLRAGEQGVVFPDNCFPPALAFSGAGPPA